MTTYPRMVPGVRLAPAEDGYVVEGGPRRDRFAGHLVTDIFPRLLPLLDGTRPDEGLAALLGQPGGQITRILNALADSGAVELRDAPPGPDEHLEPAMRMFLRRSLPPSRGDGVWRRLGTATALVTGDGQVPDLIAALLRTSGVGSVRRTPRRPGSPREPRYALTIDVTSPDHDDPAAGRQPGPRLPVRVGQTEILVGPLLDMPGGRCGTCCTGPGPDGDGSRLGAGAAGVAAGLAAGVAVRYLGGYGTSQAWQGAIRVGADLSPSLVPRQRQPGCSSCGRPDVRPSARAAAEDDRDLMAEIPPRGGDFAPMPVGNGPGPPSRRYLTGQRLDPRNPGRELVAGRAPDRDAWRTLSWILERAVGTSRRIADRGDAAARLWSPSVGGVGPLHAYLMHQPPGGPAAAWYFDRMSRDFVALPPAAGIRLAALAGAGSPACTLVLVGDVASCRARTGSFAWRAVHQDAGAAVAQLYRCGQAVGWQAAVRPGDHQDAIIAALDLDPGREAIAAVIDLVPAAPSVPPGADRPGADRPGSAAARRVSSILRRSVMTYRFGPEPLRVRPERLLHRALTLTASAWSAPSGGGQRVGCALYVRRVTGMHPGLYDLAAAQPAGAKAGPSPVLEEYLGDRRLDPPVLALFHADPALTSSGHDAAAGLVSECATAASFARLSSTAAGLRSALFARLPPALLDAVAGSLRAGPRVYAGLAIGHAAEPGPGTEVIW
jgi:hypothetical protein